VNLISLKKEVKVKQKYTDHLLEVLKMKPFRT
jgi:hypothetical protein